MEIKAEAKYIRVSPRKLLVLVSLISSLKPKEAVEYLRFVNKSGSQPLRRVITSALAIAQERNLANQDQLRFKQIQILSGPAMKRFRAVSRGRAAEYKKRMSHIRVFLTDYGTKS